MEPIKITVMGSQVTPTVPIPLVAGTVGLSVTYCLDSDWDNLEKIAVFRAGGKTMDVLYREQTVIVPWELMKKPGCRLWAGIYGTNDDGTLQIPSVWADLGVIAPGADPSGDESADPSLPIWKQLSEDVERGLQAILNLEEKMISGEIMPVT